jgi:hypothetical protein
MPHKLAVRREVMRDAVGWYFDRNSITGPHANRSQAATPSEEYAGI